MKFFSSVLFAALISTAALAATDTQQPAASAPAPQAPAAAPANIRGRVGIAAVVNEDIITFADVNNRVDLFIAGRGNPPPEILKQMQDKAFDKLVDEKLQMQEAKSLGITVGDDQVQKGFATIAGNNKTTPEEFKAKLLHANIKPQTLYDQIRAEIAWGQVVRRKLRPQINIAESDIDSEFDLMAKNPEAAASVPAAASAPAAPAGEPTIHLKQIAIPVDAGDPEQIIQAKIARAKELQNDITSCAGMDLRMKDFPGEGTGDLGDVPVSQLPPQIASAVQKLAPGLLSDPIRANDGIAVVMVCGRSDGSAPAAAAPGAPGADDETAAVKAEDKNDPAARDKVANKIGLKRLMQMADRYLRDLRAAAFVDKRF